jgi:cytochrome P450
MNLAGGDVRAALDVCRAATATPSSSGSEPIRPLVPRRSTASASSCTTTPTRSATPAPTASWSRSAGPTALIATDDPEHLRRRRAVQPAFHARQVDGWARAAAERFEAFVADRVAEGAGRLLPALRPVVLEIVLDVLLGRRPESATPAWPPTSRR